MVDPFELVDSKHDHHEIGTPTSLCNRKHVVKLACFQLFNSSFYSMLHLWRQVGLRDFVAVSLPCQHAVAAAAAAAARLFKPQPLRWLYVELLDKKSRIVSSSPSPPRPPSP